MPESDTSFLPFEPGDFVVWRCTLRGYGSGGGWGFKGGVKALVIGGTSRRAKIMAKLRSGRLATRNVPWASLMRPHSDERESEWMPAERETVAPVRVRLLQDASWPKSYGGGWQENAYSRAHCCQCGRDVGRTPPRWLLICRTDDGEWWVIKPGATLPPNLMSEPFKLPIGPDCLRRHPEYKTGLTAPPDDTGQRQTTSPA